MQPSFPGHHGSARARAYAAAVVALALGPAIFLRRKGDRLHHRISWTFATTMLVLNGTAFAIYDLFGHWGTFHYAAIASTLTLAMGLLPERACDSLRT